MNHKIKDYEFQIKKKSQNTKKENRLYRIVRTFEYVLNSKSKK